MLPMILAQRGTHPRGMDDACTPATRSLWKSPRQFPIKAGKLAEENLQTSLDKPYANYAVSIRVGILVAKPRPQKPGKAGENR